MRLGRDVFLALAAICWADGEVQPEEAAAMMEAVRTCGLNAADQEAVEAALVQPVDLDSLGKLELSEDERLFAYAIGAWLANADGVVYAAELKALERVGTLLGLSEREQALARAAATLPFEGTDTPRGIADLAREIAANSQRF